MMQTDFKRQVAQKLKISDISSGTYKKEESSEPNYVMTRSGIKASRVNIVAVVVDRSADESNQSIIIDDGTDKIIVREFDKNLLNDVKVGDVVLIIGKPREFGEEKYILPEILRILPDQRWMEVRKKELNEMKISKSVSTNGSMNNSRTDDEENQEFTDDKILDIIRKKDSGNGADISEIIKSGVGEKEIMYLIQRGDVFEIRPGKLKVLE